MKKLLSNKFSWIILGSMALVLATIGYLTYFGFLETYRDLDKSYLDEDVSRIERTVADQLVAISDRVADWSTWDDTYNFVKGNNPGFITENMNPDSLSALGVDFVIFVGVDGSLHHAVEYEDSSKAIQTLTQADVLSFTGGSRIFDNSAEVAVTGFSVIRGQPVAFASRYLTDNLARKPRVGRLILADRVATNMANAVSTQMLRDVKSITIDEFTADIANSIIPMVHSSFLQLGVDVGIGYFPLNYDGGEVIGYLKFVLPRTIVKYGRKSAKMYAAVYFVGSVFLILGLALLLRMKVVESNISLLAVHNQSLELQNNYLQELVDSVPGYVSWFDDSLRYIGINKQLAESLGRKPSDFHGRRVGFLDKAKPSVFTEQLIDFFASTENARQSELFLDTFGEQKKILLNLVKFDGGRRLVAIGIDFTETYHLQQQAIQSQQRFVDSARLAALGEMAGGIAHEINSPLSIILAASEGLAGCIKGDDSDRAKNLLTKINRTVTRIGKIIHGLRAFAREGGSDPFVEASFAVIIQDALDLCRERFHTHNVKLILKVNDDALISCRSVQIGQVMINLLNNAFDAVTGQSDAWVSIETEFKDGNIYLYVDDSGRVIDEDTVKKMMNPFFTTKPVGKGTGLGLSISKSIVEDHCGKLYYDDTHTSNTRFVMVFSGKKIEKMTDKAA
jgi:signal transduction histidine kinase/sensor domain CHASE-containing protein